MCLKPGLRVALLAGGSSSEREVSLKGAEAVKKALLELGLEYRFFDPAFDLEELVLNRNQVDVAFLVLHGLGGEDGTIQGFLDSLGIPYQGAGVLGSSLAIHKGVAKALYESVGIKVPKGKVLPRGCEEDALSLAEELGYPLIVKPASHGSSVGLRVVRKKEELLDACKEVWKIDEEVLIEEYLEGREITVGVLGEEALPVVEVIPKSSDVFDYQSKYTPGLTEEVCPAPIGERLTRLAQSIALKCHRVLRLRDYSRTDMILVKDEVYVLETNTIPGMTETSLLPLAARVAGIGFTELVKRLLDMALKRGSRQRRQG